MKSVLYLSIEGVLSHLGFSQVFRVIEALAAKGVPYTLVSMERTSDVEPSRVEALRRRASAAGIDWHYSIYREGGSARLVAENLANLAGLGAAQLVRHRSTLLHARAYHGALVAVALGSATRTPWIFDARGFWVDERLEEGRWFTTPVRLRAARTVERGLFRRATGVVTLTELQAIDVGPWRRPGADQVTVIPTCADFQEFRPRDPEDLSRVPRQVVERLRGRRVLGIVGSLNRAYRAPETAALVARTLNRDSEAQVLVLSAQTSDWVEVLTRAGVPHDRLLVQKVAHEDVPEWMSLMTWGLMLLTPETRARRAMMPTKLAEYFATGVRVCLHGCSSEVESWVRRVGTGHVLPSLDERSLDAAAGVLVREETARAQDAARSRMLSQGHFSLESGVERYRALVERLSGR